MAGCQRGLSLSMLATHDYNNIITCTWNIWNNAKKTITMNEWIQQDYTKTTEPILTKFGGKAAHGPRKKPYFGGNAHNVMLVGLGQS